MNPGRPSVESMLTIVIALIALLTLGASAPAADVAAGPANSHQAASTAADGPDSKAAGETSDQQSESQDAEKEADAQPEKDASPEIDKDKAEGDKPEGDKPEGDKPEAKKAVAKKPVPKAKPDTVKLKREPFKIEVELSGVFEAQKTAEIVLRPEQWSELKVLDAVEHGATVQRGDLLVTLDLEKINKQVADQRANLRSKELDLALAEQQLKTLEAVTPMELAAAERTNREVQADLDYYLKTERPLNLKSADYMLKIAEFRKQYAEEELRQLQKMYEADELTEETEEIILKRSRFQAELSRFSYELSKIEHKRLLETELARRDEQIKESAKLTSLGWQKARVTLPAALKQQRILVEQQRVSQQRAQEKLDELLADREAMRVTAPIGGVVYYGQATRGKFSSADSIADDLVRGGSLSVNKVFMTIVQPRPVFVRASLPERNLEYVAAGLKGTVRPTGFSNVRLTGIVERVSPVPISPGTFEARVTVAAEEGSEPIMPGMSCKVKFLGYVKKNALTLPPKAVGTDPLDDAKHYVMMLTKDDQQKKRPVTVGKKTDDAIEMLKGLKEGDEVLAEFPNDK
jgi:HlyD family secretion protein